MKVTPTTRNVPDPRRWWALALLYGAFFMVLLDGTIVLVALPSIKRTSVSRSRTCSGC
jgi:hypothetical protein